jgi:hypothetical protein
MRIRTVKPSFWKSETLAKLPKETRLLAIALLNYADDEGYFMANDALIRGECFPFDEDSKSIRRGLQELSRSGYIALGTTPDGQRIGRVVNFLEHQRVDKASPSKIREKATAWDDSTNTPGVIQEPSHTEKEREVGSRKGNGKEIGEGFQNFWTAYPSRRRVGRGDCEKRWVSLGLDTIADQVICHVEAMKRSPDWQREEGKFVPNAATYLNQQRWRDGAPEAPEARLVI